MKKGSYILITIILLTQVILFNTCKKPERILKVKTITVSSEDISYNQVEIKGEIIDMGDGAVTNHGISLREANSTGADFTKHSLGAKYSRGVFSIVIDKPEPNTKYEYEAFAISGGKEFTGDQKSFTSLDISAPSLETYEATDITQTKVRAGAKITDEGGLNIIDFGFCWNKSGTPTLNDSVITNNDDWDSMQFMNSEYIMEVSKLEPGTEYYMRAYAINLQGTGFGNEIVFKTFDVNTTGTFTDTRDGNIYNWVEIGDQVWMAENLAYLPSVYSPDTAGAYFTLYYVYGYEGNNISEAKASDNYNTYGVLYNWNAALNGSQSNNDNPGGLQGVCPDGWHLPSDNEWKALELHLGMTTEEIAMASGRGDKGGAMKEGYYEHWLIPNTGATNITGFSALPGGAMIDDNGGSFENLGQWGIWWTSTEAIDSDAWNRSLNYADNKIYYNGDFKSNAYSVRCIEGQGASLPVVTTTDATDTGGNSATLGGVISDDGNSVEGEAGIYYGTTDDPVSEGTKVNITGNSGEQSFQQEISPLTENQTYYYLAYARNIAGTSYGELKSFMIIPEEAPSVSTVAVSSVTSTSAACTGNVTDNGSSEANDRGFCYNTTSNPTTVDNIVQNNVNGTGEYTETLTGLTPGTTYYVKAYAANNEGISYGEQIEFTTLDIPSITTEAVINIDYRSAESGGNITDNGGDPISARGVCWGTAQDPDISGEHTTDGSGTGSYPSQMTGLEPGTTYYVRAYATNNVGSAYGQEETFTTITLSKPTVSTGSIYNITETGATADGEVTDDGGSAITERGVCYGTSTNPTVSDNVVIKGGDIGSFSALLTGLTPGTTYYVKAYAANNEGISYGEQIEFTTITLPSVSTESVINIDHQSAESGGNINDDGGSPVTNRGICWDTSPGPTKETNTGFTNDGEGTGMFSSSMTGLEANTLYYLRAYATNDVGTSYGDQLEFTTERNPDLPAVTTSTVLDIDSYTAVSGGEISDQGSSEVLLRGVCWSVSTNPTIDDEYTEDGAGTGTYTSNITGLYSGTTYYVRAFASNSYGIAYGNELSFTTLPGPSTVEIGELRSKAGLVSVDADIIRDGGAEITGRGFVWSTAPNPDLSLNDGYSTEGQGSGTYTGEISGLSINTDYYVRAWATNSEGTSYSEQLLFHFWDYGTITDIDGNSYNTVTIGSQVWMAENLRVARYTTAIPIPGGLTNEEWETTTSGAYAVYPHSSAEGLNSEEEVLEAYGALYNWYAVETGNLCPTGWRVPTEDDWTQLTDHLLNNYDSINSSNISNYLKSRRQVDSPLGGEFATSNHPRWDYDNDDYGKDFIGFSALPGGYRSSGGTFWYIGSGWYFWLFTEASVEDARYSYIYNRDGTIRKFSTNKLQGNTVRCTKE